MASDKAYLGFSMEQLSGAGDINARPMIGEYVLNHRGKAFGSIYGNDFSSSPPLRRPLRVPTALTCKVCP